MDAAAVAAARGLAAPVLRARHFLLVAALFGGFQALMPLLGWQLGQRLGGAVAAWDHWIAFVLLVGIGIKMIAEANSRDREVLAQSDVFGLRVMLTLAVATSIDAFAVGITLPLMDAPFALSLVTIGITTAILSALGLAIGRRFGAKVGHRMDMLGGVVLVGLGAKILIEHLTSP